MKKKSSFFRIDEQVFFTLAGLCVLSLILIAFRFATRKECVPIEIVIKPDSVLAGHRISFVAKTSNGASFAWDFGDTTNAEEQDPSTSHIYKTPGNYLIRVTVNGSCSVLRELYVGEDRPVLHTNSQPMFVAPLVAYVNEPVTFEDTSSNANAWEWRFEENGSVESNKKKVIHTYYTTGRKLVTLKVNGRNDLIVPLQITIIEKEDEQKNVNDRPGRERPRRPAIIVNQNPEIGPIVEQIEKEKPKTEDEVPKQAAKPKVPEISHADVETMFMGVVNGRKTAADFSPYLCNSASLITYDGKFLTLAEVCEKLKKIKRVKKVNVNQKRNAETNCIEITSVIVQKKKPLEGLFD